VNGKQVFKSLKTESAEHAKTKLSAVLKEFAKMRRRKENVLTRELSRKRSTWSSNGNSTPTEDKIRLKRWIVRRR
jgi:hypothetical protein